MINNIKIINDDCMNIMKDYSDNHFDLAIVDPPYGMPKQSSQGGFRKGKKLIYNQHEIKEWDIAPDKDYFIELMRVSKNQIIWGGNYFIDHLYSSSGIICWDKYQPWENFSQIEFAWTSFQKGMKSTAKLFRSKSNLKDKIHPTQKPVKLYTWLLAKYAKEGDLILDTHLGSGSSAIACYEMSHKFVGIEIDKEYYSKAKQRINDLTRQEFLF